MRSGCGGDGGGLGAGSGPGPGSRSTAAWTSSRERSSARRKLMLRVCVSQVALVVSAATGVAALPGVAVSGRGYVLCVSAVVWQHRARDRSRDRRVLGQYRCGGSRYAPFTAGCTGLFFFHICSIRIKFRLSGFGQNK